MEAYRFVSVHIYIDLDSLLIVWFTRQFLDEVELSHSAVTSPPSAIIHIEYDSIHFNSEWIRNQISKKRKILNKW